MWGVNKSASWWQWCFVSCTSGLWTRGSGASHCGRVCHSKGRGRTAVATWRHRHCHRGREGVAWTDISCLSLCPASRFAICTWPSLSQTPLFYFRSAPENQNQNREKVHNPEKVQNPTSKLAVMTHITIDSFSGPKNGLGKNNVKG